MPKILKFKFVEDWQRTEEGTIDMSQYVQLISGPSNNTTAETQPNVAFQQPSQIQDENQRAFVIVNETPAHQTFPLSFHVNKLLTISIVKIIIGVLLMGARIANFRFIVSEKMTRLAFPIWGGIIVSTV